MGGKEESKARRNMMKARVEASKYVTTKSLQTLLGRLDRRLELGADREEGILLIECGLMSKTKTHTLS